MEAHESFKKRVVSIRDYKLKELADVYKVSQYMMRKRIKQHIKKIGKLKGYYFDYDQVKKIFELIQLPSDVVVV